MTHLKVLRNIEARSCNHCCSGKAINITQPVCVFVALGIVHAMSMGRIYHLWPAPLSNIFSTDSHKRHDLRKKILSIKCVFRVSLQHLSEIFFILRRTERDMVENVYWSSCKVPFFLARF